MSSSLASRPPSSASHSHFGFVRPPRLRRGDTIGVVAPSSPQRDDQRLKRGIRYFESLGYNVRVGEHLWKRYGYLAGSDDERVEDLNAMLNDSSVRMVIAGRGGYGMTRIIDRVDYRAMRRDPKIIVGFSDVTALNCAALRKAKLITFSGAMPGVDFGEDNVSAFAEESFWRCVTSARAYGSLPTVENHGLESLAAGRGEGWLLAGNLTLLATIAGTPFIPKTDNAIVLVEEIGEEAYRVDRLLSQLWNAGILSRAAGLIFGAFTGTGPRRVSVDPLPIEDVLSEYARRANVPTLRGLDFGHIPDKLTLPLGVRTVIDAGKGVVTVKESGVS